MRPRAWAAFVAVSVLWGVPYYFIKIAVEEMPPGFLAWSRVTIGALILLPLAWKLGALRGVWARRWWVVAFATAEISIPFVLIPVGERWVSSSLTAILIAAVPLTVAVLAIRFAPSERPTGLRLVGLFIGLAGVVALLGIDVAGQPLELLGSLCVLGATVGYAVGPMIAKTRLSDLHSLGPVAVGLALSSLTLTPLALAWPPERMPSSEALWSIAALGVACTALALTLFFFLVTEAGPSRATVITYVSPTVAVALGVTLLGERPGAGAVAGLLLILAGSWLSTGGRIPPGMAAALVWPSARGAPWPRPRRTRPGESEATTRV